MGAALNKLLDTKENHDQVATPQALSKLIQEQIDRRGAMTPQERLYTMFSVDEHGHWSPEMTSTYDTAISSFVIGGTLGGFVVSKAAYLTWMENNKATAFRDPMVAKRSLQDAVTKGIGKGILMWGWRTAAFCTSYQLISTSVAVYRGKFGILEHTLGGCVAGTMYKLKEGPRGVIVGCILGGVLGTLAGAISTGVCHLMGIELDHLRYYRYAQSTKVEDGRQKELLKVIREDKESTNYPLYARDKKLGAVLDLDNLDTKSKNSQPA